MTTSIEFIKDSVSQDEYRAFLANTDFSRYTKSDAEEVKSIEDLLELRRGVLLDQDYYVGKTICKCGRKITFIDFVSTALSESSHSKAFLIHPLLGNRYGFQTPRVVKCSACGEVHPNSTYKTPNYSCREG